MILHPGQERSRISHLYHCQCLTARAITWFTFFLRVCLHWAIPSYETVILFMPKLCGIAHHSTIEHLLAVFKNHWAVGEPVQLDFCLYAASPAKVLCCVSKWFFYPCFYWHNCLISIKPRAVSWQVAPTITSLRICQWFLNVLVIVKSSKLYYWLVIHRDITNNLWQICVVKILKLQGLQNIVWQLLTQVRTSLKVQRLTSTHPSILPYTFCWHDFQIETWLCVCRELFLCFKTAGKIVDSSKRVLWFPCLSLSSTLPIKCWLGGGREFLADNSSLPNPQSYPVHPLT